MNYNFEDFTIDNYKRILGIASEKYNFYGYEDLEKFDRGIIWRHDIDYSVNRAYKMSEIENDYNIGATYFVMLHSDFYNVLEKEISNMIKKIYRNGGKIGLHFEPAYYELSKNNLEEMDKCIRWEREILENIIESKISAFSFHNPDTNGGFMDIEKKKIGGLINIYHKEIASELRYCSDSNGYWRFERLEDFIKKESANKSEKGKLQILTHPAWWQDEVMLPRERLQRCVEKRAENTMKNYDQQLLLNNRLNIQ